MEQVERGQAGQDHRVVPARGPGAQVACEELFDDVVPSSRRAAEAPEACATDLELLVAVARCESGGEFPVASNAANRVDVPCRIHSRERRMGR